MFIQPVRNVETLPRIIKHLKDLRCCDSDAITLECHVEGKPEPNIFWEKDGKISGITPNATYLVATDAGFKGWFNGRYQDFGCTHSISSDPEALGCNNQLASGSADLIMKKGMSEIKGSIAMRSVRATPDT